MAYTKITKQQFEDTLNNLGKSGYQWTEWKEPNARETVYMVKIETGNQKYIYVKIFSSIVDGVSRDVGADAIRVLAWDKESKRPILSSEKRVNRTDNWSENLKKKINEVVTKQLDIKTCTILGCGGKIIRIKWKGKEFDGCTNYKNHKNIVNTTKKFTENDLEYWE